VAHGILFGWPLINNTGLWPLHDSIQIGSALIQLYACFAVQSLHATACLLLRMHVAFMYVCMYVVLNQYFNVDRNYL
jgi:hypothetical protein